MLPMIPNQMPLPLAKFLVLACMSLQLVLGSCKHEVDGAPFDAQLFQDAVAGGSVYYVGTPTITGGAGNSPHGFMRIRFDSIAYAALDTTGVLPIDQLFPNGSIIVKEVYTSATGSLDHYTVMKKDLGSPVEGSGWVWGEYLPDGTVKYSALERGAACISCHSQAPNRDLVRAFDLH